MGIIPVQHAGLRENPRFAPSIHAPSHHTVDVKEPHVPEKRAPEKARESIVESLRKSVRESARETTGRRVRDSRTEMVEVVLPQDANVLGNILGGRVMHLVDIAGAIAAHRHCRSHVVTASVDHLDFRNAIRVGELIVLKSSVNRAFHTSLEAGVKVFSENVLSGERKHTTSAYLTYVAVDAEGRPIPVPPLICETPDDRRRFREALARRKTRLAHRAKRSPLP
jgi:acyl-CoA hydrolase